MKITKDDVLDEILRSSVPDKWINGSDALYTFNEVRVTVRYHDSDFYSTEPSTVEILEFSRVP